MKECKISTVRINERDELSFKVLVKREDYSDTEMQLMKNASVNWDLLDLSFSGLVSWDIQKQEKSNLARLNWVMSVYCDKANLNIEEEIKRLYTKYNVTTRKDISASDVESEIESYKMGILEYN